MAKGAQSEAKRAKTGAAQAVRRETKALALLQKQKEMAKDEKERAEEMRKQRNRAWAERRGLVASVAKCQLAIEARDKKVEALQGRWEEVEEEAALLAMGMGDVQEELGEAERVLLRARGKMGEEEKAELGRLVGEIGKEADMIGTGASVSLVGALGKKKGERWSQDVIELGMELMAKNLSGEQAESVTRAFVAFQHPHLVENVDYRIPSAARFKEWRMFLGPICHFIAVSIIRMAVRVHLLHDATTKDGISVFQTAARVEMPDGSIAQFPVKFDLLPTGEAATEASIAKSALGSDLGSGVYASLVTVVSATSDNAARVTSRELRELRHLELKSLRELSDEALKQAPEKLRHAAEAWLAMSEEQREVAESIQGLAELGCAGHSVNLTIEDSHKKSERESLEANVVRDLAVNVLQRFYGRFVRPKWGQKGIDDVLKRLPRFYSKIGALLKSPSDGGTFMLRFSAGEKSRWVQRKVQRKARGATAWAPESGEWGAAFGAAEALVWQWEGGEPRRLGMLPEKKGLSGSDLPDVPSILITLSKAFSPFGDDATYYLNESKHLQRWCDANGRSLINLPSRKGSRQGWTLSVGTAVMLNVESYSEYMNEIRADDQELNLLISGSWEAVKDKYFVAAVSARSFMDVVFARPLNYFVHSDFSGRHDLSKIMACAEKWISDLVYLDDIGKARPPALTSLSSLILTEFPGWQKGYSTSCRTCAPRAFTCSRRTVATWTGTAAATRTSSTHPKSATTSREGSAASTTRSTRQKRRWRLPWEAATP
jgi:hypothetical protein